MHECIQKSIGEGVRYYFDAFPILENRNINEQIKLENIGAKARKIFFEHCPDEGVIYEYKLECDDFVGYIDALVPTGDENEYDIWDFKYSRKTTAYAESAQVHLYKHFIEQTTDYKIRDMYYLCMPKTSIRQKKSETLYQFRQRITEWCETAEPVIVPVSYDISKVVDWYQSIKKIYETEDFAPNETKLCLWCDYQKYCEGELMELPKNQKRDANVPAVKRKVWLYGAPFSGKSTLCDSMPNTLFLNTDGNINYLSSPYIEIKDIVTTSKRLSGKKPAWAVFEEVLTELEKKDNSYENIVIDLVDDVFESCRQYIYNERGIEHESDDSFKMWDIVRNKFYAAMRRFLNLDYKGLYIISHADMTENLTTRNGEEFSKIKPSIQDKVARKLAGMVDIVGYVCVERGKHLIKFPDDDIHFGGGRLKGEKLETIPNKYEKLCEIYPIADRPKGEKEPITEEASEPKTEEQPKSSRRERKNRTNE